MITSHSLKFLFASFFLTSCGGNNQQEAGPGGWGFGGFGGGGPVASVEAIPVQAATISEQVNTYGTIQAQDVVSITIGNLRRDGDHILRLNRPVGVYLLRHGRGLDGYRFHTCDGAPSTEASESPASGACFLLVIPAAGC